MKSYIFRLAFVLMLSLPAFGQFSGAVPDEIRLFDGAMASLVNASTAPSNNPSVPGYTNSYSYSNELVVTTFMGYAGVTYNWTTAPCTGSCSSPWTGWTGTNRLDDVSGTTTAGEFSPYVNTYTQSSAAALAAVTGTYSASTVKWNTATLPLIPSSGSITVRTLSNSGCPSSPCNSVLSTAATSATLTSLTGQSTGDFLYACVAYTSPDVLTAIPLGFAPISTSVNSNGEYLNCYAKTATAVDNTSVSITSFTGTSGTLTFTNSGTNSLSPGNLVTLSGFTGANTGLNGQTVTVLSTGLSSTTFEATVTGSGYSSGSGTASTFISITSFTGTSGTLTFSNSGTNNLSAGTTVMLSGFTGGNTGLNGQTVTVLSAGLSSTTFEATVTGSGYSSGSGTATADYVFTQSTSGPMTAFIMAFANVLYPDELLTAPGSAISITSFTGTSGTLTFTNSGTNGLISGQTVTLSAFTGGNTALNSQVVTVLSAGLSSTTFEAAVTGSGYSSGTGTATPSFTSADVGKDICVASKRQNQTAANIPQACGTVGAVLSSTTLVGWGVWNTSTSTANFEVRYGTDNTTALQNAINNAPNGGTVLLPSGGMMILGTSQSAALVTFPLKVPVNLEGQGSGMANWGQQPHTNNANAMGSELVVANTGLSGSAIVIAPSTGPGGDANVLSYHVTDFTLWGGAGTNADGGGPGRLSGIKSTNVDRFLMENVAVGNFGGNNIEIYATVYSDQNTLINVFSTFAGGDALYVHNISNNQNTVLINSQFENSVGYGIHLGNTSGGIIWAFVMTGANTVDRNGGNGTGTQMFVDPTSTVSGCDIGNTYWEYDGTSTNVPLIGNISLLAGCNFSKSQTLVVPNGSFASTSFLDTLVPASSNLSGFGTSPSVVSGNIIAAGLVTFRVNVGTGGTASTGTVGGLAAALNGWNCSVQDTTNGTNTRESSFSTTSVTVTGAAAWPSSDVLVFNCSSF